MAAALQLVTLVMVVMAGAMAASVERVFFMEVLMKETEKTRTSVGLPDLPDLVNQLGLSDLYDAVVDASLGDALSAKGPFTLFAPTNKAFDDAKDWVAQLVKNVTALRQVLEYHVLGNMAVLSKDIKDELSINSLMGKPIRFNIYGKNQLFTAQCAPIDLAKVDQMAANGVLHELKALMVPPYGNIAETAVHVGQFNTLVKALGKAGLVDTLASEGPFTVFAPTDAAFGKLDPQTLANLLNNKTALTDVLLYHVTKLTYCKAGLALGAYKTIEMLNKQKVQISVNGDEVKVNNIMVQPAGVNGGVTNGVIHVIDTVLIPPSLQLHP
ncbi:transforming growth factor-beta-induced protein ig-h3-like isoform X2 [Babylonia areolata]